MKRSSPLSGAPIKLSRFRFQRHLIFAFVQILAQPLPSTEQVPVFEICVHNGTRVNAANALGKWSADIRANCREICMLIRVHQWRSVDHPQRGGAGAPGRPRGMHHVSKATHDTLSCAVTQSNYRLTPKSVKIQTILTSFRLKTQAKRFWRRRSRLTKRT